MDQPYRRIADPGLLNQAIAKASGVVHLEGVYPKTPPEPSKVDASPPPAKPPIQADSMSPLEVVSLDPAKWKSLQDQLAAERARADRNGYDLVVLREQYNEMLAAIAAPINLVRRLSGASVLDLKGIEMILRGR